MSWKQKGGLKQYDQYQFLNVTSVITDSLTLREPYEGLFNVDGNMIVSENTNILGNLDICGSLLVLGGVTFEGNIFPNNVYIQQTLDCSGLSTFHSGFNFDVSNSIFMKGVKSNIGINVSQPTHILDIKGNQSSILNIASTVSSTTNILSQNSEHYGIVFHVDSSQNAIQFYHKANVISSNIPESSITYSSGQMEIDVCKNILFSTPKVVISDDSWVDDTESTLQIYNNNQYSLPYLPHVYDSRITNVTLKMISNIPTSNTFLRMVDSSNIGWNYGGGYQEDRHMGSIGWTDLCNQHYVPTLSRYIPSQTMLSGNSLVKSKSTIGINTFKPQTEDCVLDVNGPVVIRHNEIHQVVDISFEIVSISFAKNGNQVLATGFPISSTTITSGTNTSVNSEYQYGLLSSNNLGQSWAFQNSDKKSFFLNSSVFVYDDSLTVRNITNNPIYYNNTESVIPTNNVNILHYITKSLTAQKYFHFIVPQIQMGPFSFKYYDNIEIKNSIISGIAVLPTDISYSNFSNITTNAIDGFTNQTSFYIAGNNVSGAAIHFIDSSNMYLKHSTSALTSYQSIRTSGNTIFALGTNCLSLSINSGTTFFDISFASGIVLNDAYIVDSSCAIVVGNQSTIFYSRNYYNQTQSDWTLLTPDMIVSMGNANTLLDISNDFISVHMKGNSQFIFTSVIQRAKDLTDIEKREGKPLITGQSKIYYCYLPQLFYPLLSIPLLSIDGNMKVDGYIDTSNASMFIASTSSNICLGNENTRLTIGKSIYMQNNPVLEVSGSSLQIDANSVFLGDIVINGNLQLLGTSNIQGTGGGDTSGLQSQITNLTSSLLEIDKTLSPSFYVNGNTESSSTAGSGFYIYNTITGTNNNPENNNESGFFRISNYKENHIFLQNSFSVKSTGSEKQIRLNIQNMVAESFIKSPLLMSKYVDISNTNKNKEEVEYYNDDNAEILSSNLYIDPSGNLGLASKNIIDLQSITMTGLLSSENVSANALSTSALSKGIIYAGSTNGLLSTQNSSFTYNPTAQQLSVPRIAGVTFSGTVDFSKNTMSNVNITTGNVIIASGHNLTVSSGTLDVSAGTFTTTAAQKSDIVNGVNTNISIPYNITGSNFITSGNVSANALSTSNAAKGIVYAGSTNGLLSTQNSNFTYDPTAQQLSVPRMAGVAFTGTVDFSKNTMSNVNITTGNVIIANTFSLSVNNSGTLNVSSGTFTTSPAQKLDIVNGVAGNISISYDISGKNFITSGNVSSNGLTVSKITCSGNVTASIVTDYIYCKNSPGNIYIGSALDKVYINGNLYPGSVQSTSTINTLSDISFSGNISCGSSILLNSSSGLITATAFSSTSSIRYKKNIEALPENYNLDMLMKYKPITYQLQNSNHFERYAGFIAEDLANIGADYFVHLNEHGNPDSLDYSRITVHLIKCVQELYTELKKTQEEIRLMRNS